MFEAMIVSMNDRSEKSKRDHTSFDNLSALYSWLLCNGLCSAASYSMGSVMLIRELFNQGNVARALIAIWIVHHIKLKLALMFIIANQATKISP